MIVRFVTKVRSALRAVQLRLKEKEEEQEKGEEAKEEQEKEEAEKAEEERKRKRRRRLSCPPKASHRHRGTRIETWPLGPRGPSRSVMLPILLSARYVSNFHRRSHTKCLLPQKICQEGRNAILSILPRRVFVNIVDCESSDCSSNPS